jgi:hypothetical protein
MKAAEIASQAFHFLDEETNPNSHTHQQPDCAFSQSTAEPRHSFFSLIPNGIML